MNSELVLLLPIHDHPLVPWNDMRKGDCCGRLVAISDGYYCKSCDVFFHKTCGESYKYIKHPSHSGHILQLRQRETLHELIKSRKCHLCGRKLGNVSYHCAVCKFDIDLYCAKYPPPEVLDISEKHGHKLTLVEKPIRFVCEANCGETGDGFPYICYECGVGFHMDCIWHPEAKHPLEVNHSHHSLHPLKLLMKGQLPHYSDGKCRLCGSKIDDKLFYHCSFCNFTLDLRCVLHPPSLSHLDLKTHHHRLTLLPRLDSFTCNACGLKGDRSPYICVQCDFIIHQDCVGLPRVININRHDHRVSRISIIGVVDSVCGVCRKKVDWTYGGYSCQRCSGYIVHSKCATREDVWNGKELEDIPEEIEDVEPYVVIDDNTIQHFSHTEHHLRLNVNGFLWDDNKRCRVCTHPICLQSFYGCMDSDCDFTLHQNCAKLPRKKRHVLHNDQLTLVTSEANYFTCYACSRMSNGFKYHCENNKNLDGQCGSIYEPFVHPSHPHHPLYYIPRDKVEFCNGCDRHTSPMLRCIEDDCRFFLCFECATLPQVVKHRVDDHPLSLCYGEKASGKNWCDICEEEINLEIWFYTCKDHRASLHVECVLGHFSGLMPRSTIKHGTISSEVVLNNSSTRPFCTWCKSRCIYSINLKMLGTSSDTYICSLGCLYNSNHSKS